MRVYVCMFVQEVTQGNAEGAGSGMTWGLIALITPRLRILSLQETNRLSVPSVCLSVRLLRVHRIAPSSYFPLQRLVQDFFGGGIYCKAIIIWSNYSLRNMVLYSAICNFTLVFYTVYLVYTKIVQ